MTGDARATIADALRDLGLELPPPLTAKGRYLPAVVDGGRLWVSGHTGRTSSAPALAGVVGRDVSVEDACASARIAAVNVVAASMSVVAPARLAGVLFLRGYVRAESGFGEHPTVVDAASEVLERVLGGGGHARAAVGVPSLPGGACVELEVVLRLHPER